MQLAKSNYVLKTEHSKQFGGTAILHVKPVSSCTQRSEFLSNLNRKIKERHQLKRLSQKQSECQNDGTNLLHQ